jgi:hypothetical protein
MILLLFSEGRLGAIAPETGNGATLASEQPISPGGVAE